MSFSLVDDPWIPAIDASGARCWITLADITARDSAKPLWRDLDWGRPDLRIAAYELLIGLLATAFAPKTTEEFLDLLHKPPPAQILRNKLAQLANYLILDGDGPRFQQDRAEIGGDINPPDALFMDAPGANTLKNGADLFVKRGRMPVLSRKGAAIALHALQAFAPSGGAGHRTSMRGGGPLTTLVVPPEPDLWRRIAANLPILRNPDRRPPQDLSFVFPWARDTRVSRGDVVTQEDPKHHSHWLQHYFGMPRRIRLVFEPNRRGLACGLTGDRDDIIVTGFRMEPYGVNYGVWQHPLTPYYRGKSPEFLPLHPRAGRIGYRDWVGYLFASGGKGPASCPAQAVTDYAGALKEPEPAARLLAAGYVTDNMKTEDYVEAEVPLVSVPNQHARGLIAEAARFSLVGAAELAAGELRRALIASLGGDFQKTPIAGAVDQFWIATEDGFVRALTDIATLYAGFDSEASRDEVEALDIRLIVTAWLACFRAEALRIFSQTVALDRQSDLPSKQRQAIMDANRRLHQCLGGYGAKGRALFDLLSIPLPSKTPARENAHQEMSDDPVAD